MTARASCCSGWPFPPPRRSQQGSLVTCHTASLSGTTGQSQPPDLPDGGGRWGGETCSKPQGWVLLFETGSRSPDLPVKGWTTDEFFHIQLLFRGCFYSFEAFHDRLSLSNCATLEPNLSNCLGFLKQDYKCAHAPGLFRFLVLFSIF